jgi:glycosyltransferase involved in cell wall biosynthesis
MINSDLHLDVLVNVSGIISGTYEASSEKRVISDFTNLGPRVSFLAWDSRVPNSLKTQNIRFLPEPKHAIPRKTRPLIKTIGFYGKLSFERGLFDFLLSVFFNPKLHYRISGYGFNRKHLYRSRNFISMRQTPLRGMLSLVLNYFVQLALLSPRVSFEERYFLDEKEMSSDMQLCSAVFFSCTRSPYSSGLVYQSLASGIPVVWSSGNSAMAYVLESFFPPGKVGVSELFRWNGLFNSVDAVDGLTTAPVFDYGSFDEALSRCPFC